MKPQRLTESEIMRKYSNIVAEAQEPAIPQQSLKAAAQKVAQTLTPEEQKQLQTIIAQVGKNPQAIAQAVGITPQDAQAAVQEGYMTEETFGISPSLKGKLLQALHVAVLGAGGLAAAGAFNDATQMLPAIGLIALAATPAFWSKEPGMVGAMGSPEEKAQQDAKAKAAAEYSAKLKTDTDRIFNRKP
jgi:hypothetical protein